MNRSILKNYAPQARRDFIQAITDRASFYGLTKKRTEPVAFQGDVALIGGRPFPKKAGEQRKRLEERIARQGFEQTIEAVAYTWFNRLVAIRFMELHEYLEHGYRVLSHPEGKPTPEILEQAEHVDLPGLDPQQVIDLKLAGDKDAELYRMLLIAQCNALHRAMPFLFERIDDETELLLPDTLLHSDSLIRTLVSEIPEEDWQEVEIIGWLYQFYISEKKDQVIGKVVKSEDIPAATQLFTPNWIVKYLVQNSLGRQWVATYPDSPLKGQMEYYIEPAEQSPEVQEQLKAITPTSLNPEELTLLDPACGSGHILVEAYDLLKAIYQERGYRAKDIPRLILTKNLYGLEIDDRAAQLAAFALMMKARADDRRIFAEHVQPHVLSIQESKGLDAREITDSLNQPILKEKLPPSGELFEEIADEKSPLFSRKNLAVKGDIAQTDIAHLIDLFEHGKTFGSLIRVPEKLAEKLPAIAQRVEDVLAHGGMFEAAAARAIRGIVEQCRLLAMSYDAVTENPPYMGGRSSMNAALKTFAATQYPQSKYDLFSMFIERSCDFCKRSGHFALVTMHAWMFLSSFEELRKRIFAERTVVAMAHLGPRAFSTISGEVVQVTAFACRNQPVAGYQSTFFQLTNGDEEEKKDALRKKTAKAFNISQVEFQKIPGTPLAYWATDRVRDVFASSKTLGEIAKPRQGMASSDDGRFVRHWFEVSFETIGFGHKSRESAAATDAKWFPFNKGGSYRRWYGNNSTVVNWQNDGSEVRAFAEELYRSATRTIKNMDFYFRPGITWSLITGSGPSFRYFEDGFIIGHKGCGIYVTSQDKLLTILGFLNSRVTDHLLETISPTLGFEVGHLKAVPLHAVEDSSDVNEHVESLVESYRRDWDSAEISWGFIESPLLPAGQKKPSVRESLEQWERACDNAIDEVRRNEQHINSVFIEAYGLQDELSPEVPDDQITLYRPDRQEDIKRLISYAIGCMMGRYSLDKPGLIYAHSGGKGFDPNQYQTFPADEDGIIPLTDLEWFEDDAANRLEKFIATAWPKEHLEENLKFVADSLGPNRGERPRETIRRYLATGFYKHHLQMYKRRPIYWLFSSGKQRAFQCLVYLHRYNEGTLSRMRTEYVTKLQGKIDSRIDHLAEDIAAASATSHRKKLEKERDTLLKHRAELLAFDEKLRHYADKRIALDLDDGVKVNYGKFGDLLAEVKAVTGSKAEE